MSCALHILGARTFRGSRRRQGGLCDPERRAVLPGAIDTRMYNMCTTTCACMLALRGHLSIVLLYDFPGALRLPTKVHKLEGVQPEGVGRTEAQGAGEADNDSRREAGEQAAGEGRYVCTYVGSA